MAVRRGDSIQFGSVPVLGAWAAVGGKKESRGPLAAGFDALYGDNALGDACWEKAESDLALAAARTCLKKAQQRPADVDLASSHFCAAERQFRTPLNYGGKRTPTAQWTATAAGAVLVRAAGRGVPVKAVTFGRVQDYGVRDINNMGAAMAPAAAATLLRYFADTHTAPDELDAIFTGDLGLVGSRLLADLLRAEGIGLTNHADCGLLLYTPDQNVKAGGSGAGCCAGVLCAHILPGLAAGRWRRVLFVATGALMSQTTFLQRESIPAIAHLVELGAPEPPRKEETPE